MIRNLKILCVSIYMLLCTVQFTRAQIAIEPQIPSQGVVQQNQLWNLLVINNTGDVIRGSISISLQQANSGAKVLNAVSGQLYIPKGASQINSGNAGAIHYEYFNSGSSGAGMGGMLPIGQFTVCYNLSLEQNKNVMAPSSDCLPITVEPFSPPQLIFPENKSIQNTSYPVLTWLPPMPVNMFTGLNYKLIISEVYEGQAPSVAIQRNPLLFVQGQIKQTTYLYPSSFMALKPGKTYAWQIIAQNGNTYSQATDTWSFTIAKDSIPILREDASYPHLQPGAGSGIFLVNQKIKFSYDNEAGDSVVTINIYEQNVNGNHSLTLKKVNLQRGANFIDFDLGGVSGLIKGNEYILELVNRRKENWDLRFRYEPSNH